MAIYLTPTTEIHLIFNNNYDVSFTTFDFEVIDNTQEKVPHDRVFFEDFNSEVAILTTDTIINEHIIVAMGIGQTIGRVIYTDNNGQEYECLVCVKVHSTIDYFWVGNNQITIHADSKGTNDYKYPGYVPSVYAKFIEDEANKIADIGDITYHPYIQYTEINSTKHLDISNHIIKAKSTVGENTSDLSTKIKVELEGTAFASETNVKIKTPFNNYKLSNYGIHTI